MTNIHSIRYETKTFETSTASDGDSLAPISHDMSNLTILNDTDGSISSRSSMQRVTERQTVTTSSESRMEKKSQQHSYRLE